MILQNEKKKRRNLSKLKADYDIVLKKKTLTIAMTAMSWHDIVQLHATQDLLIQVRSKGDCEPIMFRGYAFDAFL